jgi:hypothetical protein
MVTAPASGLIDRLPACVLSDVCQSPERGCSQTQESRNSGCEEIIAFHRPVLLSIAPLRAPRLMVPAATIRLVVIDCSSKVRLAGRGSVYVSKLIALLIPCIALVIAFAALPGRAETVYVTDELRLGLYEGEQTRGRPFKTLVSGDALEVLERARVSIRVRTPDKDEGWVKTAYVVSKEPARRRVAILSQANLQLIEERDAANAAKAAAEARIKSLQQDLSIAEAGIENLPVLEKVNADLRAQLARAGAQVPLSWLMVSAGVALLIGALAGYFWLDRKVRRRFGGIRVY